MGHLEELEILGGGFAVVREEVIHVLLETVVVELPPLLDFARHLLLHLLHLDCGAVRGFEGFPRVQKSDSLIQVLVSMFTCWEEKEKRKRGEGGFG